MMIRLFFQAIGRFLLGLILVAMLIFLPAGSFFENGIIFLGILFVPMFFAGIWMAITNPDLLAKRLKTNEKHHKQRAVVMFSGLMFVAGFILCGLTVRFGWYRFPKWVSVAASVIFLVGYTIYAEVLRENQYVSRIVEIQEGQTVIVTGLYGIVRHPMYAATLLMFLSIPLILGSVYAVFIFLFYPVLIVKRIKNEEELLEKELAGYREYREKVKYRLLPFVW